MKHIQLPLTEEQAAELRSGDRVELTGILYTARDAAHKRMQEALDRGESLPIEMDGQIIYYVGPTPPKPGEVIGSAGPTTSSRMDAYTPDLLAEGLRGMIGKGKRSEAVKQAMMAHRAVYFAAVGGAAALIAKTIRSANVIAYEDLGTEAIYRLEVDHFPAIVINDTHGHDLYEQGENQYRHR
ncbi:Fe-S-containing hydro-lyase [Aneurinibacillus sp. REN35]|uniref:Fe-S-containing hydro-lyase n=1 Tax=Aneurinibacillus sp. REN35 TaxID=3237286 RepID=UPI003528009B